MIRCVVIVNQLGKPRLGRFYDGSSFERQQYLLKELHSIVVERDTRLQSSLVDGSKLFGDGAKIVYRNFATLYFIMVVDEAECELSTLDLIQVFVKALNSCFENVCELDIIFNFDKVNYILDEMIVGGMVMDFSLPSILDSIQSNNVMGLSPSKTLLSNPTSIFRLI